MDNRNVFARAMRAACWAPLALSLSACGAPSLVEDGGTMDASIGLDATAPEATAPEAAAPDAPPLRPPPIPRNTPETEMRMRRQSCRFAAGAWPAETLGSEIPLGNDIPIEHVLILMQENRSFDHYLSKLPEAGQTDVDVPPANWTNPDRNGTPVGRTRDTAFCFDDTEHGWDAVHEQFNNGAMDGFVTSNNPNGARAMSFLTQDDIPFYYGLATTFAISDRYFCSVLGPTWPNRYYLMSATSAGLVNNVPHPTDSARTPASTILHLLERGGWSWKDYSGGLSMLSFYPYFAFVRPGTRAHQANLTQLMADLQSGNLPNFAFIEPLYVGTGGDRVDEHPPGMAQSGSAWVEQIVRAVMASPAWSRTALFITYDEHGGLADHVVPPPACEPDGLTPTANGRPATGRFDRLGIRVPFYVVSPYSKRHFVSHQVYDHTSLLRFVEARFGLPALTARDANATPPTEMFDFANPPFMTPPTLPATRVDAAARTRCNTAYPSASGL